MTAPRLAITIGDPAGIGPEIALKALSAVRPRIDAGEFALLIVLLRYRHRYLGGGSSINVLNQLSDPPEIVVG